MSIGLRIKQLRKEKKMTQIEFSEMLGIDNSQYSKIEKEKLQPTIALILEVYSKFNINFDWLLTGEGPMLKTEKERTPGVRVSPATETGTGVDTTNIAQKYEYLFLEVERLRKELKEAHKEIGRLEERLK